MRRKRTRRKILNLLVLMAAVLLLVRCVVVNAPETDPGSATLSVNLPAVAVGGAANTPTAAPPVEPTAETTAAEPTATPTDLPTAAPTPTATTEPTAEPTATPTETPVPPTPTPTVVVVTARVNTEVLNVRQGPGTTFGVVAQLGRDAVVFVLGQNADASWLQICCVNGDQAGWVSAALVAVTGDLAAVPLVEDLATPTP